MTSDGEIESFDINMGVLQDDTLAPFLFIRVQKLKMLKNYYRE